MGHQTTSKKGARPSASPRGAVPSRSRLIGRMAAMLVTSVICVVMFLPDAEARRRRRGKSRARAAAGVDAARTSADDASKTPSPEAPRQIPASEGQPTPDDPRGPSPGVAPEGGQGNAEDPGTTPSEGQPPKPAPPPEVPKLTLRWGSALAVPGGASSVGVAGQGQGQGQGGGASSSEAQPRNAMGGLFGKLSKTFAPGSDARHYVYLNAGLAYGFGVLTAGSVSFHQMELVNSGLADGYLGALVEVGYFPGAKHLLSLGARIGRTQSDTSKSTVLSWQVLARYRYYFVTGLVRPYLGAEVGGGPVYLSARISLDEETEIDTFELGPGLLGAFAGVEIGLPRARAYLELAVDGLFPKQSTVAFALVLGVVVSL